jgi:hypothetical protein
MDNRGKQKSFAAIDEINTLLQGHAHVGTHVEVALQLRFSETTLNIIVMNSEETEEKVISIVDLLPSSGNR